MEMKEIRKHVNSKFTDKTTSKTHSELYYEMFGKIISEHEARKRLYGVKQMFESMDEEPSGSDKVRCIVINDLHLPFERDDVLEIVRDNKDVDYILIAGDLLDCVSCSSFAHMESFSVEDELVYAHNFISKVNTIIDPSKTKIIAIRGNHEERYHRAITKMLEKQMQSLLNPQLLSMLEDGFTVYPKGKKTTYKAIENFQYIDDWYARLFDNLIIAHPLNFSNVGGKVSEQISEYMLNQGIADREDVIVTGHTHKFSTLINNRRQGLFVVENACLCQEHEYAKCGKLNFTPQNYGYTYLEFYEGRKIDINDVKFIHLK